MTLEPGKDWGSTAPVPEGVRWAADDHSAALIVTAARRANKAIPPIALTGGDLARTLGGRGERLHDGHGTNVEVDVGAALIDGRLQWFVAHLVVRRSWLRGQVVVAANAAFIGKWNIAPRAHPGDGRLDLIEADPGVGDRLKARSRLRSGTHLPHPDIITRRVSAVQLDFDRDTPIRLDGQVVGRARSLSVRVEPAAMDLWI